MLYTSADVGSDVNSRSAADVNRHWPTSDPMLSRPWEAYIDSHRPTLEPMLVSDIGCQFGSTWAYVGPCRPMSADMGSDVASPHGSPMLYTSADVGSNVNSTSAADVNRHRQTSDLTLSPPTYIDSHRPTSEPMLVPHIRCRLGSTWADVGPCRPMSADIDPMLLLQIGAPCCSHRPMSGPLSIRHRLAM